MTNQKLVTDFEMTDAKFEAKVHRILQSFTGNHNFPYPQPTLALIKNHYTIFIRARTEANRNISQVNNVLKNTARRLLEDDLKQLAQYAMEIADGDERLLATTGFTLSKKKEQYNTFKKPANVKMPVAVLNKKPQAEFYEFLIAPGDQSGNLKWQKALMVLKN